MNKLHTTVEQDHIIKRYAKIEYGMKVWMHGTVRDGMVEMEDGDVQA